MLPQNRVRVPRFRYPSMLITEHLKIFFFTETPGEYQSADRSNRKRKADATGCFFIGLDPCLLQPYHFNSG